MFSAADVHYRVCWLIIHLLSSAIILGNVLEGMRSLTILTFLQFWGPYHDWGQRCGTFDPGLYFDVEIAEAEIEPPHDIIKLLGVYLNH